MIILKREVPEDCQIALLGDTHIGSTMVHKKGIEQVKRWLLADKKKRYFCFMGDAIEAITVDDKRYDEHSTEQAIPLLQAQDVIKMFKPVAPQCLTWLKGNHEDTVKRFGNLSQFIADSLGAPYGTWTTKMHLLNEKTGKLMFKMFLTHGFRGRISSNAKDFEQQQANMKASLKNKLHKQSADCLIMAMGHTHLLMVVEPSRKLILKDDGEDMVQDYLRAGIGTDSYIEPDRRFYCNSGAFLKLYQVGIDGYAERAGYNPVELGYLIITVKGGTVEKIDPYILG